MRTLAFLIAAAAAAGALSSASAANVTVQPLAATSGARIDFANAKAMPLPQAGHAPSTPFEAQSKLRSAPMPARSPGAVDGRPGTGITASERIAPPSTRSAAAGRAAPEGFGSSNHPFSTARANIESMKIAKGYPFTAVGRLFFNIDGLTYVCSGSLIKPGVVLTAGHCVSQFGANRYYTDFTFVPVYSDGVAPFGAWKAQAAAAHPDYLDGTTPCSPSAPGVVCQDDMALLILKPKNGQYPGTATGTLGYAWDASVYTKDRRVHVTQLGYPVDLDRGELMERNDSEGFVDPDEANNTVIGSAMTGGSSGGPWVNNWGIAPQAGSAYIKGKYNVVVGVTSWGWTLPSIKEQGAAPFLSSNIVPLVDGVCSAFPGAC